MAKRKFRTTTAGNAATRKVPKVDKDEIEKGEKVISAVDVDRDDLTQADKEANLVEGTLAVLELLREGLYAQEQARKKSRGRTEILQTADPSQAMVTTGDFEGSLEEALMVCAALCAREGIVSNALTGLCASHAADHAAITAADATLRQLSVKLTAPPPPVQTATAKPVGVAPQDPAEEDVEGLDAAPQSADGYATDTAEGEWSTYAFTVKQLAEACPRGTKPEVASIVLYIPKSEMYRPPEKPKGPIRVRYTNLERGVADKLRTIEEAISVNKRQSTTPKEMPKQTP